MITVPGCRVLLKPFKIEEHDKAVRSAMSAGIHIPESSQRKQQITVDKGVVLALGPSTNKDYTEGVSVGDVIGFAKYGGKYITDPTDDQEYLIINDEEIVCIFKAA